MITEAQPLLQSYATRCRAVIDLLLSHLETHLGLPPASLLNLHRIDHRSGDHIRFTQNPPQAYDESRAERGEHTDFGSITILFNWLGGLQIRTQPDGGVGEWVYVKPVPGSCIVNLGDAMVKFTGGILRSNIHRVVPPPGQQSGLTRNSLVFFSRPEDEVVLKRLKGGLIDAQPVEEETEEQVTSKDWVLRRAMGDLHGIFTHTGGLERKPHGEYVGSRVTPAVVV
jgi:isopenicillin N synthase-like dioxygenase